ncbi:dihydroneopterin aldolase [Limosilactobacillus mucosae]
MGRIRINNMKFHTYNGVFAEEKKLGQKLEIDIDMQYPIEKRVLHDDLNETVSYADVYDTIKDFVTTHSFDLIESVANELLKKILADYSMLEKVTLRIRKYSVPIDGVFDNVEIEVAGENNG